MQERLGIIHGGGVFDRVVIHARESLDDMERVRIDLRSHESFRTLPPRPGSATPTPWLASAQVPGLSLPGCQTPERSGCPSGVRGTGGSAFWFCAIAGTDATRIAKTSPTEAIILIIICGFPHCG